MISFSSRDQGPSGSDTAECEQVVPGRSGGPVHTPYHWRGRGRQHELRRSAVFD